ncbi:MAG TPA: ribonuclease D [Patescibacteria group bacterium]|jgi:ribonuclease D|nr:ribonuclease D [Patescibacteria group bacterium]
MTITLHQGDLPAKLDLGKTVAVDTEAMGLNNRRDRLCLVQVSSGDGMAHLVQIPPGTKSAPHLEALMGNPKVCKIFHYARFDIAILKYHLGIDVEGVYCTKIASTLCRTFTDRHSLRELCRDLLDIELSKQQQSSDWGAKELTQEQMVYAANDVLHLHAIKKRLDEMLKRENRLELAHKVMEFVPVRAELDLAGWSEVDIFAH